jgi:hypothetical protein
MVLLAIIVRYTNSEVDYSHHRMFQGHQTVAFKKKGNLALESFAETPIPFNPLHQPSSASPRNPPAAVGFAFFGQGD